MTAEQIARALGGKPSGHGWQCHCPAHDDERSSLSLTERNGKTLLKCHAGCTQEAVIAALKNRGLWGSNGDGRARIVAAYDYQDEEGDLLYQVVRLEPKTFRQRRPNGAGEWEWNLNGTRRVLFRLPQVIEAVKAGRTVYIVEGEKDVLRLADEWLEATCNAGGAGKWRREYARALEGARVVILPDNDEPGRKHAEQVARSLRGTAASVKVLDLPGLPDKGDVSDWLKQHGVKELEEQAKEALEWTPPPNGEGGDDDSGVIELISMEEERTADIPPRTWFVENMITTGFNLIIAKKGIGKSFFVLDMAVRTAWGYDFLGHKTTRCGVLYIPTELDRIALHERLQRYVALPENLFVHYSWSTDQKALDDVEQVLMEGDISVVVFDMFLPIVPSVETNAYESSSVFLRWRKLFQKYNAGLVAVWHSGKSERQDFMDSAIGTTGLIGQSDSVLYLERKRGESGGKLKVGGNHGSEMAINLSFDNCRWETVGVGEVAELSQGDMEILDLVEKHGSLTPTDAAAMTDRAYDGTRMALARLKARGYLRKTGRGLYHPNRTEQTEPNRT